MIYKNKFVALYDQEDNCVFVGDNWYELANFLEKPISNVQSSMSHIFKKNEKNDRRHFNYRGKKLTPYLFEVEE